MLRASERGMQAAFALTLLDSKGSSEWRKEAIEAISRAEAVIVYDRDSCVESPHAGWEVQKAEESELPIVDIHPEDTPSVVCSRLRPLYDFQDEFEDCFSRMKSASTLDLYRIMVDSSEALINRRQRTNAFFITAIGSIFAIAGLSVRLDLLQAGTIWLFYVLSVVGLILCNSWQNLIDNYGKLNKAKFDVILRLEQGLDSQIFAAEWLSLGKGLRPKKYRSFTSTESNVPRCFFWLILILMVSGFVWQTWNSSTVCSMVCQIGQWLSSNGNSGTLPP